jgi:hypothetical protein
MTGLSRSEVGKVVATEETAVGRRGEQHPARRVLAAWYDDSKFLGASGDPSVLPIFGGRRSFEQLVAKYSGGIPVRAMLDQLAQIDAIEILNGRNVRAKTRVPIFTGMTTSAIAVVGERVGDLLITLSNNLRTTGNPFFEGTAMTSNIDPASIPLIRREITEQGSAFIDSANALLRRSLPKTKRSPGAPAIHTRVGVTIYYFQEETKGKETSGGAALGRRKNLQRQGKKLALKSTRVISRSLRGQRL